MPAKSILFSTSSIILACNHLMAADLPASVYAGAWKSGHLQGMAIDDERRYMYFSFTSMLVKTDMTGKVIGTVTDITGHLGDLAFHQGRVYGSLEFKNKNSFYIAIFDVDKISGMNIPCSDGEVMKTVYLEEVARDYGYDQATVKHRYGCSGIDGISFGTVPGSRHDETKLMVAYGIYGDNERTDNDHQVILQYDPGGFTAKNQMVLDKDNHHTRGPQHEAKYFIYTGNTKFGVQNLEYDKVTKDYWMGVYKGDKPQFPNHALYLVDGRAAPVKGPVKGQAVAESGLLLSLAKQGVLHEPSGVYGFPKVGGNPATGIISLGQDYFYMSRSGVAEEGGMKKQFGYALLFRLDRETGVFSQVKAAAGTGTGN